VNFNSGTSVHFQGGNIGTYATYLNGSWFADALFLANFMSANFNSSPDLQGLGVSGFGTNTNVQQFGGHLDIGYAGSDTKGLVSTGAWKSEQSASRYAHAVVSEEATKASLLPFGEVVENGVEKKKA
jgi:hypothetical protein